MKIIISIKIIIMMTIIIEMKNEGKEEGRNKVGRTKCKKAGGRGERMEEERIEARRGERREE